LRLLIDILQGAGLSAAAGIRPFLPALVAGAFARADFLVDYEHTSFAFLETSGWMLAMILAAIVVLVLERRGLLKESWLQSALAGIGIGLGALLFAGTLDDRFDIWWPGLLGGALCAAIAGAATRSLLGRTGARLDDAARGALTIYADGLSMILAALAVVVAPVSVVALGFFLFLLRGARRRDGEKYAGLRILR
jgi:hypothetical protein